MRKIMTNRTLNLMQYIAILTAILLIGMKAALGVDIAQAAKDTKITTEIKTLLLAEKDIASTNIHVTTKDSKVSLSGEIDTRMQFNRVIELVSSVDDVSKIDSGRLIVKNDSNSHLIDSVITATVHGKIINLSRNGLLDKHYAFRIETYDGVVHIWGHAANKKDIDTIVQAVRSISDVEDVKTNLSVLK